MLEGLSAADPSLSRAGTPLQIIISEKLLVIYFRTLETDFSFNTVFRTKANIPLYLIVLESTMRKMEKKYLLCEPSFTAGCLFPFSSSLLMGTQHRGAASTASHGDPHLPRAQPGRAKG